MGGLPGVLFHCGEITLPLVLGIDCRQPVPRGNVYLWDMEGVPVIRIVVFLVSFLAI
jgi:hypothetical protein